MRPSVLILSVGNVLLGDEGVGVHAVRMLEGRDWPENVHVLDGGTGGFHLLSCFQENEVVVLIDAALDGRAPGIVALLEPRFASEFPRSLSAHDIRLRDLVEAAAILGYAPKIYLITVSIADLQDMGMTLSPAIESSLKRVVTLVDSIVKSLQG